MLCSLQFARNWSLGVEINLPKVTHSLLYSFTACLIPKRIPGSETHTVRKFPVVTLPSQEKQGHIYVFFFFFFLLFVFKWCIGFQSTLLRGQLQVEIAQKCLCMAVLECVKVRKEISVFDFIKSWACYGHLSHTCQRLAVCARTFLLIMAQLGCCLPSYSFLITQSAHGLQIIDGAKPNPWVVGLIGLEEGL